MLLPANAPAAAETEVAPRPGPGRPKDSSKRAAIMKAARKHFLQFGYGGASMDAVATEAGVSKLTIYSHFASKDALFQEVVRNECMINTLSKDLDALAKLPTDKALHELGMRMLKVCLHPDMLNLHRLMVAQAAQQSKISKLFYEAGPEQGKDAFAAFIGTLESRGEHKFGDPHVAAKFFCSMVKGDLHYQAVLNLQTRFPAAELEAHVTRCVGLFLKAFAA